MVKINFVDFEGNNRYGRGGTGRYGVMETGDPQRAFPAIDAECGGAWPAPPAMSMSTTPGAREVGGPEPMEEDMLDFAFAVKPIFASLLPDPHHRGNGRPDRPHP